MQCTYLYEYRKIHIPFAAFFNKLLRYVYIFEIGAEGDNYKVCIALTDRNDFSYSIVKAAIVDIELKVLFVCGFFGEG